VVSGPAGRIVKTTECLDLQQRLTERLGRLEFAAVRMVDQRDSRTKYFPGSWGRFGFTINSERFRESTIYSVKERGPHGALRSHQSTPNPFGLNSVPC
jgi:hypothetical protein